MPTSTAKRIINMVETGWATTAKRLNRWKRDDIVRQVRFDGLQATHAGEREVKKALRQTLFKYKLHQGTELFERASGYIREYY